MCVGVCGYMCVCVCVCVCLCVVRVCRSGVCDHAQTGQTGFIMTGSEPGRGVQLELRELYFFTPRGRSLRWGTKNFETVTIRTQKNT